MFSSPDHTCYDVLRVSFYDDWPCASFVVRHYYQLLQTSSPNGWVLTKLAAFHSEAVFPVFLIHCSMVVGFLCLVLVS